MDQFLAWLNVHRRRTQSSLGRMDQFHTSGMELVLWHKSGGSISYHRSKKSRSSLKRQDGAAHDPWQHSNSSRQFLSQRSLPLKGYPRCWYRYQNQGWTSFKKDHYQSQLQKPRYHSGLLLNHGEETGCGATFQMATSQKMKCSGLRRGWQRVLWYGQPTDPKTKKGGGFIGSGLDHILQSHRATYYGIILGTILNSKLVQSRNARTLHTPSPCKSPLGTLHPWKMDSHHLLR